MPNPAPHSKAAPAVRRLQSGGAVLALVVSLLVMAAATLAIRLAGQVKEKTAQQQLTQQRMARIGQALQAYWLVHGCTLPGGAVGASSTGDAAAGGTTVPWRTLGIASQDALDAWGRKISYRSPVSVAQFGAPVLPAPTWGLVSHGPTGLGAWLQGGQQMPPPLNVDELANASGGALQLRTETTGTDVLPANLFDDALLWGTLEDICTAAVPPDVIRNLLDPAQPPVIVTRGNGSGLTSIDSNAGSLGTVHITSSGGEISTNAAYEALGVCSSGCGAGNNSARALDSSESLSFRLVDTGKTAQGLALGLLGITSANTTVAVSITFKRNGLSVGNVIQFASVNDIMPTSPQLLNLSPSPATSFDEVIIQPVGSSRFYVAIVRFCATSTTCN